MNRNYFNHYHDLRSDIIDQKYEIQRLDFKIQNLEYEQCKLHADRDYEKYSDENKKAHQKCFTDRWN